MTENEENNDAAAQLRARRDELESLDREIVGLIARRLEIAKQTAALKQAANLPILDPQREAAVIRNAVSHARELGVPEEPIREIFWHVVGLARRVQEQGK